MTLKRRAIRRSITSNPIPTTQQKNWSQFGFSESQNDLSKPLPVIFGPKLLNFRHTSAGNFCDSGNDQKQQARYLQKTLPLIPEIQFLRLIVFLRRLAKAHDKNQRLAYHRCILKKNESCIDMAISRNAPCPCGSGKKFKRCCGAGSQVEPEMTAEQLFRQAFQHQQQGQTGPAINACRKGLQKSPKHEMGHALHAQLLTHTGDNQAAAEAFKKAISLGLKDPSIHFQYGNVLLAIGDVTEAIRQFESVISLHPQLPEPHINLGNIYIELELFHEAENHLQKATELAPSNWKAHAQRAIALVNLIRHDEAMQALHLAIKSAPDRVSLYTQLASLQEKSNLMDEAESLLDKALSINSESPAVKMLESNLKIRRKDYESAWQAISSIDVDENNDQLEGFVANIAYQRGDVLDKLQHYEEALQNYHQANRLMKSKKAISYDTAKTTADYERQSAYFTHEKLEQLKALTPEFPESELTPIFIVGFFRSGTTLTEQILASHPDIVAAGELNYIEEIKSQLESRLGQRYPECLDRITDENKSLLTELRNYYLDNVKQLNLSFENKRWVTDKAPLNMLYLPLIHLLFPESPLINTLRHPMDSALSCYFHQFSRKIDWSFDLDDTIDFFCQSSVFVKRLITRLSLPVHAIRYETLVETPEPLIRSMLEYIGADWHEACLEFHKNNRVARTLSYAQVNQPIYTGSKLRYLNYSPYLKQHQLTNMRSAVDAMGYEIK